MIFILGNYKLDENSEHEKHIKTQFMNDKNKEKFGYYFVQRLPHLKSLLLSVSGFITRFSKLYVRVPSGINTSFLFECFKTPML